MAGETDRGSFEWWNPGSSDLTMRPHEPGGIPLREEHWEYFEGNILPLMHRRLNDVFPDDLCRLLRNRLAIHSRFRASEILFALLSDLGQTDKGIAIEACAAVEFLQIARLVHDDVIDKHDYRWGYPTVRMSHDDDKAQLVASELKSLALVSALVLDRQMTARSVRSTSSPVACIVEFGRRMNSGMLAELLFTGNSMSEKEYTKIAKQKHCNGHMCVELAGSIVSNVDPSVLSSIREAAEMTDLAAAIANDVTEVHQRRGLDEVRFEDGERRGDRTEIELNRPTIFHVFIAADERLKNLTEEDVHGRELSLSKINPAHLLDELESMGAIDYSRSRRDSLMSKASKLVPTNFVRLSEWMKTTARLNLPS